VLPLSVFNGFMMCKGLSDRVLVSVRQTVPLSTFPALASEKNLLYLVKQGFIVTVS